MIKPLASFEPFLIAFKPSPKAIFNFKLDFMKNRHALAPIRVAVLIDGGYFIKRYNTLYNKDRSKSPETIVKDLCTIALSHVGENNYLYRIFYYDCIPFEKKVHNPVSNKCIDFSKTSEATIMRAVFEELKRQRKVALRLGTLKDGKRWVLYDAVSTRLIRGEITIDELTEKDVYYDMHQKGIDMKIGVDIASLALKRFVDRIVLISGDSDFVPAAKLARREGIDFVLDPMHSSHVENTLFEHIDGLKSIPLYYQRKQNREMLKNSSQTESVEYFNPISEVIDAQHSPVESSII